MHKVRGAGCSDGSGGQPGCWSWQSILFVQAAPCRPLVYIPPRIFRQAKHMTKNLHLLEWARCPACYYAEKLLQEGAVQHYPIEDIITHQFLLQDGARATKYSTKRTTALKQFCTPSKIEKTVFLGSWLQYRYDKCCVAHLYFQNMNRQTVLSSGYIGIYHGHNSCSFPSGFYL